MDEQKMMLRDAFGESSDSDVEERRREIGDRFRSVFKESPSWEQIGEINGLWLCRDFLCPDQQSSVLSLIEKEGWFTEASHNQAMRFGNLPLWAIDLSDSIREVVFESSDKGYCLLPSDLLWRDPLFDQLIMNIYQPGNMCSC